jgi:hypothetical protein
VNGIEIKIERLFSLGFMEFGRICRGSAPVPTPKFQGNHGGIASTIITWAMNLTWAIAHSG